MQTLHPFFVGVERLVSWDAQLVAMGGTIYAFDYEKIQRLSQCGDKKICVNQ